MQEMSLHKRMSKEEKQEKLHIENKEIYLNHIQCNLGPS